MYKCPNIFLVSGFVREFLKRIEVRSMLELQHQ
jgi:hypothetical protein